MTIMTPKKTSPFLLALLLALAPQSARAETPEEAFARGQQLAKDGKLQESEAAFELAWKERKAWDIGGNLGLVEAAQQKWDEAAEHLDFALNNLGGLAKPEQREALEQRLAEARTKVAQVDLETTDGANVKVGERDYGKAPLKQSLFLLPGPHKIVVSRTGFITSEQTIDLSAGAVRRLDVALVADTSGGGGGAGGAGGGDAGRPSWPGWLMGGVGLAAAGVGAALVGVGQGSRGDADSIGAEIEAAGGSCEPAQGPGSEKCADVIDSADSAGTLSSAGIGLLGGGGALLIAGIIYLVIPDDSPEQTAFRIVPVAGPNQAGVFITGAF